MIMPILYKLQLWFIYYFDRHPNVSRVVKKFQIGNVLIFNIFFYI